MRYENAISSQLIPVCGHPEQKKTSDSGYATLASFHETPKNRGDRLTR